MSKTVKTLITILIALLALGIILFVFVKPFDPKEEPIPKGEVPENTSPTPPPEPTPTPLPIPYATEGTKPTDETHSLKTAMELNGQKISTYNRQNPIYFDPKKAYSALEGVITHRGNNFRDDPTYGSIGSDITGTLTKVWEVPATESIAKGGGSSAWFGCGWTGQPLIAKWPQETLDIMNIKEEYKNEGLVEVIYPTEGATIYFLDLYTGEFTRDKIKSQWTFKGAGSLDPRGYPLLYVGAGDASPNGPAENMIYSLIDGKKLFSYGADDPFSLRAFKAFDGATIVHPETDSVTYASESGIVYQFDLNTKYDPAKGTISVDPKNMLKWNYSTKRSREGGEDSYWLGFESSPVFYMNYMYASDNAGNLFCLDINTMETVWVQDVQDDTNCSPVFELIEETGKAYLYIGTSTHWTTNAQNVAKIPFWKIDAITGEKVWEAKGYNCRRDAQSEVSGGIQDTAALGKHGLSNLVFVTYSRIVDKNNKNDGSMLVAYDKMTGDVVWEKNVGGCSWSSPVAVYDDAGRGFILQFSQSGHAYLFDGLTGKQLSKLELEGNFEASPAVYGDMVVIGSRGQKIYGIQIS